MISRKDTLLNDFKNSTTEGLVSLIFSVVSLILIFLGVYLSYRKEGKGGYYLGILMVVSLLCAIVAIILAGKGFRMKERNRHYMEKRGLILAIIDILLLVALFVRGILVYFAG